MKHNVLIVGGGMRSFLHCAILELMADQSSTHQVIVVERVDVPEMTNLTLPTVDCSALLKAATKPAKVPVKTLDDPQWQQFARQREQRNAHNVRRILNRPK